MILNLKASRYVKNRFALFKNTQLTHIPIIGAFIEKKEHNEKKEQYAIKDFNFFSKKQQCHRFLILQFCHLIECY